ncbi:ABC transporter ATP-binding protein [Fuerstiella marisgermanici]|uniref:Putative ABC transporter ATP-binding protein YxlF n=1 Tax=Fuerstiella marisgermanici TaxID=1891926 RepID=A0A1P8WGL7_9PLAN|nr:ABC transporter ATP-binding protein [Fuerstiella marisgermanici]APZ93187.1 putative ABC transporter ATP-binding protein YxlF [Fuerstiella marisgermanici]
MSSEYLIELNKVTKLYGTVIGVNDFSMQLKPGAYGLLGPNGAGKSTLLNLLIGQLVPTRGTVRVLGQKPRNNAKLMSKIGFCPGFEGLYASTTGHDWVTFLLELHGTAPAVARERAEECMALVGMAADMARPIASYSRGMRQRTKLAQAIAHEPTLLILDEPFSGLDPIGRAEMTAVLREWIKMGNSLIIASHVLHEIEALTDSFLLICGGRLLASGTAAEVNELLFDTPSEIDIDCDQPHELAALLMKTELATSIAIQQRPHGVQRVHLQTVSAGKLCTELPELIAGNGLTVTRLHSADNSLQTLFNSLLRIHRGEL